MLNEIFLNEREAIKGQQPVMSILFLDTETGGLDSTIYDILSIGWCLLNEGGEIIDRQEHYIYWQNYHIDLRAFEINRISPRMILSIGKPISIVSEALQRSHNSCHVIGGYNLSFDLRFLNKYPEFSLFNNCQQLDLLKIIKQNFSIKDSSLPNYKMATMINYFGLEDKSISYHGAGNDAYYCALLYKKLQEIGIITNG